MPRMPLGNDHNQQLAGLTDSWTTQVGQVEVALGGIRRGPAGRRRAGWRGCSGSGGLRSQPPRPTPGRQGARVLRSQASSTSSPACDLRSWPCKPMRPHAKKVGLFNRTLHSMREMTPTHPQPDILSKNRADLTAPESTRLKINLGPTNERFVTYPVNFPPIKSRTRHP